jgi:hypothetical protein
MDIALLIIMTVAVIALVEYGRDISTQAKSHQSSLEQMCAELNELRDKVAELTQHIERVALTPAEQEKKHLDRLPALTSDTFIDLPPDTKLDLILEGFGQFYQVEYTHRELAYRTPGGKDAVAYGKARFNESGEFQDVRILFSRPNSTATLRGLAQEGRVKIA